MWNLSSPSCPRGNATVSQNSLTGKKGQGKPCYWCVSPAIGFSFLNFSLFIRYLPAQKLLPQPYFSSMQFHSSPHSPFPQAICLLLLLFLIFNHCKTTSIFSLTLVTLVKQGVQLCCLLGLFLSLVLLFHWIFFTLLNFFSAQTEFPPVFSALVCFWPEHMNSWSLGTADLIGRTSYYWWEGSEVPMGKRVLSRQPLLWLQ